MVRPLARAVVLVLILAVPAWGGSWHLLTPPLAPREGDPGEVTVQSGRPLGEWVRAESYGSAMECERGKSRQLLTETEILIAARGRPDEKIAVARVSAASLGRCVDAGELPGRARP